MERIFKVGEKFYFDLNQTRYVVNIQYILYATPAYSKIEFFENDKEKSIFFISFNLTDPLNFSTNNHFSLLGKMVKIYKDSDKANLYSPFYELETLKRIHYTWGTEFIYI